MDYIENRTFDEINVGDTASLVRTLTKDDISLFAVMSGDVNPAHLDEEYARSDMFHKIIAHGMWGGALISTLLGTCLPGPGTIYLAQTLRFRRPVAVGDTVTVTVKAVSKDKERHRITFDCTCTNQQGEAVISGNAEVIAPTEKVRRPRVILPQVHLHDHGAQYRRLLERAEGLEPIRAAVVYPVDPATILGTVEAAHSGLIVPLLIGPETKIRAAAAEAGCDLGAYTIVDTPFSQAAALRAVAMARSGEVDALVAGSQRPQDFLRTLVARDSGMLLGWRMSHVFVLDVPTYPRPLLLTDAVMNISPNLEEKRDILQNAFDLAVALGIEQPKAAVLAAVETLNPRIRSTVEAAALCKMVERQQIKGGLADGPLTFDSAVSPEAAQQRGIGSPIAGQADILVVPDLETGTMLIKQLEYMAEAQAAGVIMGARVPIALNDRTDNQHSLRVACAISMLLAHHRRGTLPPLRT